MNSGHNSTNPELKKLVERIERLESEKHDLGEDIKAVYAEAKRTGFEPKIIRELIKRRREDPAKRAKLEEMLDTYRAAVEGILDTPLGKAGEAALRAVS